MKKSGDKPILPLNNVGAKEKERYKRNLGDKQILLLKNVCAKENEADKNLITEKGPVNEFWL